MIGRDPGREIRIRRHLRNRAFRRYQADLSATRLHRSVNDLMKHSVNAMRRWETFLGRIRSLERTRKRPRPRRSWRRRRSFHETNPFPKSRLGKGLRIWRSSLDAKSGPNSSILKRKPHLQMSPATTKKAQKGPRAVAAEASIWAFNLINARRFQDRLRSLCARRGAFGILNFLPPPPCEGGVRGVVSEVRDAPTGVRGRP